MNVVKCKNGHFFDNDTYNLCPHCGAEVAGATAVAEPKQEKKGFWGKSRSKPEPVANVAPAVVNNMNYSDFGSGKTPTDVLEEQAPAVAPVTANNAGHTLDFWQTAAHAEAAAVVEPTPVPAQVAPDYVPVAAVSAPVEIPEEKPDAVEPVAEIPAMSVHTEPEPGSLKAAVQRVSASSEGKTMSYFSAATSTGDGEKQSNISEPVVGWLVCIGGKHFGESFNIYAGKNSIGRSAENRIVIELDNSISRNKHALIVYEPKKRNFYLQPGDSSGLTYLNEDYITESKKLSVKDVVELGDSKFLFVPLCGEEFSWEDYMPKAK